MASSTTADEMAERITDIKLQDTMTPPVLGGGTEPIRTPTCTITPKRDPNRIMKAIEWHGKRSMKVTERRAPAITDPGDVILRVTSTAICGSDLHLYLNDVPGMHHGDVLGHEFMGVVEQAGPEVKKFKPGDRVVACFDIACGACFYCRRGLFTACDTTNPSREQEELYGHRTAGLFGYAHVTGGWEGGQAELVRVPLADNNLLKVPEGPQDEHYLFLSDILPTAWHACELGEVGPGDRVAIWGAGPVGILAAHCAQVRGAAQVVLVDEVEYRLQHARAHLPGVQTINFRQQADVVGALQQMISQGPDVAIEAVGFHYAKTAMHKVQVAVGLETDTPDMLNEMIKAVRKGGRISIVGVYVGLCNQFMIGAFMEKGLTMRGGQTPVQRYWLQLLQLVESGQLRPEMVVTHRLPLAEAPLAYKVFNDKQDGCIKVVLKPGLATSPAGPAEAAAEGEA